MDLIVVRYSFVYPMVKVIDSHVSKIHMARHECERKPYSYSATVAHKLRNRLRILIVQLNYFDWMYDFY